VMMPIPSDPNCPHCQYRIKIMRALGIGNIEEFEKTGSTVIALDGEQAQQMLKALAHVAADLATSFVDTPALAPLFASFLGNFQAFANEELRRNAQDRSEAGHA
jgi:hypothetical protein